MIDLRCIRFAVSFRIPTIGLLLMHWSWGNGSGEIFISKLPVALGSWTLFEPSGLVALPPSYCSGLLFSFLFIFCSETVCAPLGFPYYPLLVLSSAAEDVSNFFPPCHGISPSSVLHDNEHTTDSDRTESIPLARTTRRIIRISNC